MRCCDYRLIRLASVASTNDEVLARARALSRQSDGQALRRADGRFVPLVVISAEQTAGRGRLGRAWASPPGGLYLSALVEVAAQNPAPLSLVVALAVRDALQGFAATTLRVKWPNDIMMVGGKLAGLSIGVGQEAFGATADAPFEAVDTSPAKLRYAVIGIGVNVDRPNEGAFAGAAYLNDGAGAQASLEEVADVLISTLLCRYEDWAAGGGSFAPFAEEYRAHMTLLGETVCVRDATGAEIAHGTVEGVDARGQLLLAPSAPERGLVAIAAGEVTLRDGC